MRDRITNLGGEILEDSREVDRSSGAYTVGVLAGLDEPGDPTHWELETGLLRPRNCLGGLPFASPSHSASVGTHADPLRLPTTLKP